MHVCIQPWPVTPHTHTQLVNHQGLHRHVSDAIFRFIELKPSPFPGALQSQEDFWAVKPWKRAMVFVFQVRHLLNFPAQKIWSSFSVNDYKLNVRSFKRWIKMDKEVMSVSKKLLKLPKAYTAGKKRKHKSKRKTIDLTTSASDSPMKRRCDVGDDTTDEDE